MHLLHKAAFSRARSLVPDRRSGSSQPVLTEREREVLGLVAEGLTDLQIAAMLGFTAATAHYHVERAKTRLGAATRAQAVAIAVSAGFV